MVERAYFTAEEISSCTSKEQLTALLSQAANMEVLYRTFKEYGLNASGLGFCTNEKLAGYLAGELLILRKKKLLRRKVSLIDRISGALRRKSEEMVLSFSGATLAGMMVFMLVL